MDCARCTADCNYHRLQCYGLRTMPSGPQSPLASALWTAHDAQRTSINIGFYTMDCARCTADLKCHRLLDYDCARCTADLNYHRFRYYGLRMMHSGPQLPLVSILWTTHDAQRTSIQTPAKDLVSSSTGIINELHNY